MLGRLLSGAGMMRIGYGMMRRGFDARSKAKNSYSVARQARTSAIIDRVRQKTRGIQGASNPRLFSKGTLAGQKRRNEAAALIRGRRAGLPSGMTHAKMRSAHVQRLINGVRSKTRLGMPANQLSKATPNGSQTRAMIARTIKASRQLGGSVTVNGKPIAYSQKRKFQGSRIP